MKLSPKAENLYSQIGGKTRLGDLRKMAKEAGKDQETATELWTTGNYLARQLAILMMDVKRLTEELVDKLVQDIDDHKDAERLQLIDWLMANQLMKNRKTIALMQSWRDSEVALKRRTYWYYEGRLRWVGQTPPSNTEELLSLIEERMETEMPEVQWAMNFTAGQIGIFQPGYRSRCIALGERTGLYRDEVVAKNCTPNYLPRFIAVQVGKMKK